MTTRDNDQKPIPSFKDFLRIWKTNCFEKVDFDYTQYIKSNPLIENVLSPGPCFVYMLDYRSMKYVYLSSSFKNILGYDVKEFMDGGPEFMYTILHPDDRLELMNNTFKKILDFYYSTPLDQRKKIRCAYDYRLKRADGKYIRLLQQCLVVDIDSEGRPIVDIGISSDISEYKKENKITLSLSKYDQEMGFVTPIPESDKKDLISERELQVLRLLTKGYNSKKIADQLNISINTVRNHRQHLLEKTQSKNIAELVTFALSNSLV